MHIPQSPYTVPKRILQRGLADQKVRAEAVITMIPGSEEAWAGIAKENTGVSTTLGKLGPDVVARLLQHAYILAMVNAHVVLGYPLLAFPTLEEMRDYIDTPV